MVADGYDFKKEKVMHTLRMICQLGFSERKMSECPK